MFIELQASEVSPGHCVIINHCDRPYGNSVAVVTDVSDGVVKARYLSKAVGMKECYGPVENVTPVNAFGVRVMFGNGRYWCESTGGPSSAKYRDGKHRCWQEYDGVHYLPKMTVLEMASAK